MRPALHRLLFLSAVITFAFSTAFAQTDNWLGGQGHWENAINWDNGVPVSTSDVVINAQQLFQSNTVFLSSDTTIRSLTMKSSEYNFCDLYVEGGQNFLVTGSVNLNVGLYAPRLLVGGVGSMTVGANLVNGGELFVSDNSTLKVLGDLTASGLADLKTGGNLIVAGKLVNSGSPFQQESDAGTITVTGQLANVGASTNKAGMVLQSKVNAGSVLNSNGSIAVWGSLNVAGTLNNADYVEVITTGAVTSTTTLENSARVDVYSGASLQVGSGTRGSTTGYFQYSNGTLTEHIYRGAVLRGSAGKITLYQGGAVFLDGTLNIQLQSGFNPQVGTSYRILNFDPGALSGSFANVQNAYFNNGTEMWQVIYDNANGYVALQAVAAQ